MGQDGIFGVAEKGFDLEVLLDEAEEGLDLPPVLVDVGDGPGGEVEVVGQKDIMLAGLLVPVADPAQSDRVIGPFGPCKPDDLVGSYTQTVVDLIALDDLVTSVCFHPGDKEDALAGQGKEPVKGDIGLVHDNDRPLFKAHGSGGLGLMTFGFGNGNKGRQIAVMIQQGVDLNACLGLSKSGPWEEAQAEADCGCVQGEELVLELKLVLGSDGVTAAIDMPEQGFEEGCRPSFVGLGKGGSGGRFGSQMVEVGQPGTHGSDPVTERRPAGQLDGHEVNELIPAAEFAGCTSGSVGLVQSGENMSRNNLEHLREDRATMSHGLICPFRSVCYAQHHYIGTHGKSGHFLIP